MSDLRLAVLLCTRLCHDLVGPIGAVSNGLELLGDGAGMGDDVIDLVRNSAGDSATRLKFLRAAYGLPGGSVTGIDDFQRLATAYFAGGRVRFGDVKNTVPVDQAPNADQVQILFNLILCAVETLPRGGEVRVRLGPANGVLRMGVAIRGSVIELGASLKRGLSGAEDLATVDPRRIQPYFTWRLAEEAGATLRIEQDSPESAELITEFP